MINEHIDSGLLVCKKKINIEKNDDLQSLFKKNYKLQLDLIPISLNLVFENSDSIYQFEKLEKNVNYNSYMPYKLQLELKQKINTYINRYSQHES